jgi:hypothetical protein
VTLPTGPAAGVHLPWAGVPGAVKAWAAAIGGGDPTDVRDLHGGFSPGAAARLQCPRGALFVKAVGVELNPESPVLHRREAVISGALPSGAAFPVLLDVYDEGGWVALAFEAIEGTVPHHPWDPAELDKVVAALQDVHDTLTPSPTEDLESAQRYFRDLFGGWADLAAASDTAGLDPWCRDNLSRLAGLEGSWAKAIDGQTLIHGDVRSDNILLSATGPVFVDWPHAAIGNPVLDLVAWAPSVELEGGPRPEDLLAAHRQTRIADADVVSVVLAAVSGFFVSHSLRPPPPGLPTLRRFQRAQGEVAVAWLRRRTGW